MAGIDQTVDQVFQDWDDQRIKLRNNEPGAQKLGPFANMINLRMKIFVERWRPDRMRVLKKLGNTNNASADSVRGQLTPLAREEFLSDLKAYGVPDRYAVPASQLLEVK